MSVIRDLLHGITPQKRKQINEENRHRYQEQQAKIIQDILSSSAFHDAVAKTVDIILSDYGLSCLEQTPGSNAKPRGIDIFITDTGGYYSSLLFRDGDASENTDLFAYIIPSTSWPKIPDFGAFKQSCVLFYKQLQSNLPTHYSVSFSQFNQYREDRYVIRIRNRSWKP